MAVTSNCTTAPGALAKLFEERLASYVFARDRMEAQPDDATVADADHYANAYLYTEELLLNSPVGDLSGLRTKAEVLWGDPESLPNRSEIVPFLEDLVRLTGREASRVFNPEQWLKRFERGGGMWIVRDSEVIILEPVDRDLSGLIDMLRAMDGADAVKAMIRRKHAAGQFNGSNAVPNADAAEAA